MLKCPDSDFVDFLQRCLVWDPEERITPEAALDHPWIRGDLPQNRPVPTVFRSGASVHVPVDDNIQQLYHKLEDANIPVMTRNAPIVSLKYATNKTTKASKSLMQSLKKSTAPDKEVVKAQLAPQASVMTSSQKSLTESTQLQGKLRLLKEKLHLHALAPRQDPETVLGAGAGAGEGGGSESSSNYTTNTVRNSAKQSPHHTVLLHVLAKKRLPAPASAKHTPK